MSRKRKFRSGATQHLFQISATRGLVFCTIPDNILLYTLICTRAPKHNVHILSATIMLNHFHIEADFKTLNDMESFMNEITSVFARKYNKHYGLSGQLFHRPYGNSMKGKDAFIFDTYIYIGNNAKAKKAVSRAEEYRWNFLQYCEKEFPFSSPYIPDKASKGMKAAVKKVKTYKIKDWAIGYDFFESNDYLGLEDFEKQQLIDMIITEYNVIDYAVAIRKYGSPSKTYEALNTVSGSEYGSGDDYDQESYQHYYRMVNLAIEEGYDMRTRRYVGIGDSPGQMPEQLASRLCRRFNAEVQPNKTEMRKFFSIASK